MTKTIEDMTVRELQGLAAIVDLHAMEQGAWKIGGNYFVRTVTHIQTGVLVSITKNELVLKDAAWIADTGRFGENLVSCTFREVEMFPKDALVIVNRASVIDALEIDHLPTKTIP